jgi:hypothetical protein
VTDGLRLSLAIAAATVLTPVAVLVAMPLLDPLWSIRPTIEFRYIGLLGALTFASLIVTAIPLAFVTSWLRHGRTGRLAVANAVIGAAVSLPFFLAGGHVSPAPVILGATIAIASLIVSITYLATKERTLNA